MSMIHQGLSLDSKHGGDFLLLRRDVLFCKKLKGK
jgi:hypothetical protein